MDLRELDQSFVDQRIKGMPGGLTPLTLDAIGAQGWNLLREDLPLPVAVLRQSAVAANRHWMQAFLRHSGAVIAPHGKTTMSPQLFDAQLADGAWAITVATVHQVQVARAYGVKRVILANQLVGRQAIRYVLAELARDPGFDFYCLVDSVAGAAQLAEAASMARLDRPLQLLLEGGYRGGRTGCRDLVSALAVARAVAAAPALALRGVEGFEGLFPGSADAKATAVSSFLDFLVEIAVAVEREGLFAEGPLLLSAGGSAFYDMVAARFARAGLTREVRVVTRSGCYLTHDSGLYAHAFDDLVRRSPELARLNAGPEAALEVWAYVQSRPEPEKVLLTMGKRDISYDEMPVALRWFRPGGASGRAPTPLEPGHVVTGLNDQHCHMTVPANSQLAVGDMVAFGISHPCLTFDKWRVIPVVDDAYDVVGAIRTFF
ncbi:MAG TPA: alanine racemase [Stellaceae bacterium]|nr:alanine racemase [Stellaceae bacterium]